MNSNGIVLASLLHGILGYYILFCLKKTDMNKYMKGLFLPEACLFSFCSLLIDENVFALFFVGMFAALVLRFIFNIFERPLYIFGFINIFNYYVINKIFASFIMNSSETSINFLLIFMLVSVIFDLSLTLRNYKN